MVLLFASLCALACSGGDGEGEGKREPQQQNAQTVADTQQRGQPAEQARLTQTAGGRASPAPANACDWIPVAEVEAALGPLAQPPTGTAIACRYALPMDAETAKRRAKMRAALGPTSNVELDSVALVVTVDVFGDVSIVRMSQMAGDPSMPAYIQPTLDAAGVKVGGVKPDAPKPPPGWDMGNVLTANEDFIGRVGFLKVMVKENSADHVVPSAKKEALAARIRDRIADLPFTYPYPVPDETTLPPGADPCSLLEPNEAEAVLGKLVVPPYRSFEGSPYADPNGSSCAYSTAGHHVLILKPYWTGGKERVAAVRADDALLYAIAKDPDGQMADTLDGPWEDVTTGLNGRIGFLKGDRFLQVAYLTSSTDVAGAVRLARIAIDRLARN
jgi:hypothetical protein